MDGVQLTEILRSIENHATHMRRLKALNVLGVTCENNCIAIDIIFINEYSLRLVVICERYTAL